MTTYSIKDIEKRTGLTPAFIRKCINILNDIFSSHTSKGNKNAIQIDSSGLLLFDNVKQLKEQNLSLPEIHSRLKAVLQTEQTEQDKHEEPPERPKESIIETTYYIDKLFEIQALLNEEKDKHLEEVRRKDETITDLTREKEILSGTLKLLPEGKPPEQIRQEYEEDRRKQQEVARIVGELRQVQGVFQWKRRKELLEKLEKLLF